MDLVELANYIARDSLEAAERFLVAAEEAFAVLSRMPEMGTVCRFANPQTAGLRMWTIRGFGNRVIFYRPVVGGIDIVRVVHASRDIERIFSDNDS